MTQSTQDFLQEMKRKERFSEEEERRLLNLKDRNKEARDLLIEKNLRFVTFIAREYLKRGLSLEELVSAGTVGLITAIDRFDPKNEAKLSTYVVFAIRDGIIDELRKLTKPVTIPRNTFKKLNRIYYLRTRGFSDKEIAEQMGIKTEELFDLADIMYSNISLDYEYYNANDKQECTLKAYIKNPDSNPEEDCEKNEFNRMLYEAFKKLNEKSQKVLYLAFFENMRDRKKIAEMLGISHKDVEKWRVKGFRDLRNNLKLRNFYNEYYGKTEIGTFSEEAKTETTNKN